jgi:hypothetical protein
LAGPVVAARWLDDWIYGRTNGSDVGRPVPQLAAMALDFAWHIEAVLATRIDWRVGLTHVMVLARD